MTDTPQGLCQETKQKLGFNKRQGLCKETREKIGLSGSSWDKIGISQERLRPVIGALRSYVSFWREYPDLFVDFMVKGTRQDFHDNEFQLFYYQRINKIVPLTGDNLGKST